jgi:GxxExxY protein
MHTDKLKHKEFSHLIIKGFYDVYNELGGGFLESVYKNAMTLVLQQQVLPVETYEFKRFVYNVYNKQQKQSV